MGERKVLNKYFPPDFDPSFAPRRKKPKNEQVEVRMMLPMSIQCATCGEFMYRGKKFNSKKEEVLGERYHGIVIWRFYIKCSVCNAEISFKTDPENTDYVAESGATRNFEPWKENGAATAAATEERASEETGDKMKTLENRTLDSKLEMEAQDQLDELRSLNQRHERVDTAQLLRLNAAAVQAERGGGGGAGAGAGTGAGASAGAGAGAGAATAAALVAEAAAVAAIDEEEAGVASVTFAAGQVRRLADSGSDDGGAGADQSGGSGAAAANLYLAAKAERARQAQRRPDGAAAAAAAKAAAAAPRFQVKLKKRRRVVDAGAGAAAVVAAAAAPPPPSAVSKATSGVLGGLLAAYGSSSGSSDSDG